MTLAASARADPAGESADTAMSQVNRHHAIAAALFERGQYDEAIKEFQLALDAGKGQPLPRTRYNLGVALVTAGRCKEAQMQYEEFLRIRGPDFDDLIAPVKAKLADIKAGACGNPDAGGANGTGGPSGHPRPEGRGGLGSGESQRTAGIIVLTSGAALIAVGGAFGWMVRSNTKAVETAAVNRHRYDPDLQHSARNYEMLQWISLAIGAGSIVTGGIMWATSPARSEPGRRQIAMAPLLVQGGNIGGALIEVSY